MKKFFYLLLALPLVFAACEPDAPVNPGNDDNSKVYALEITSNDVMRFSAEGGDGVITWEFKEVTRLSPMPEPEPAFTTEAQWITLDAVNLGAFTVAANDGEARESKIVVTYLEQTEEVVVKQEAKAEEPGTGEGDVVVFEAPMLVGDYYDDYYSSEAGNYYIFFTDNGFDEDGDYLPNSIYYGLDLYGPFCQSEPTGDYVTLPAGTYTLDVDETMASGTLGYYYSSYADTNLGIELYFDEAVLVVADDGSCELNAVVNGVKHKVTFSGQAQINDLREVSGGDVESKVFEAAEAMAYYRGDYYNPGVADNFGIILSDIGWDADGYELPRGTYYVFDVYAEVVDGELAIPYGTYTLDTWYTCEPYTLDPDYSYYYVMDSEGYSEEEYAFFEEGSVTISQDGIIAEFVDFYGTEHKVTYNGVVTNIVDVSDDMGDGGGDYGDGLSTLEDDWYCNFSDCSMSYDWYGDYYEVGYDNWLLALIPNGEVGDGLQLHLISDTVESFVISGEYTINSSLESFTGYPGWNNYGYMEGCWYFNADISEYAPLMSGTIVITNNGDTTFTIEVDAYDDLGNNIYGSWTGVDDNQVESQSLVVNNKKGLKMKPAIKVMKTKLSF